MRAALERTGIPPGRRDYEVSTDGGTLVTVPGFAWPEVKLAAYCDGFAFHASPDALELDAKKRNHLQGRGWLVFTYWRPTILRKPASCATGVAGWVR